MKNVEEYMQENRWMRYFMCVVGALIYSFGMNTFVSSMGFYASGIMGISQITQSVLVDKLQIDPGNINISAVLYFLLNLPLFILAMKSIGKRFLIKTGINVICVTLFLSIIPVPKTPIIEDRLTCTLIGGIICGAGGGLTLQAGGSGGGLDILGVYLAKKSKGFSVGKLSMLINAVIYGVCIFLFDVSVAVYCIIYVVFSAMIVDKVHTQSITVQAMIFTKTDGKQICDRIIRELNRSATIWDGVGGYTEKDVTIIYSVLSKYEATILRRLVREEDEHAFVVFNEGCRISGNFQKHL